MAARTLDLLPYLVEQGLQQAREIKDGVEIMGLCPAHLSRLGREDSRPSFGFNSAIGRGYCFSCQWRPDLTELVKQLTGHAPDHNLVISIQESAILRKLSEQKRKVTQDFSLNEWTLGYRFQAVPDRLLLQRLLKRRAVIDMGVRWDPEVGCWVMPIRTPTGELLGWQQRQKGSVRTYPAGMAKSSTLFAHHQVAPDFDVVTLVESPLDAVRLWQCNIPAVSAMGAGVSNVQVDLLARHYSIVVLALDDDPAGHQATQRLEFMLRKRKTATTRWRYASGHGAKDVGDYRHDDDIIADFRTSYRLG
jgi:DNA primase